MDSQYELAVCLFARTFSDSTLVWPQGFKVYFLAEPVVSAGLLGIYIYIYIYRERERGRDIAYATLGFASEGMLGPWSDYRRIHVLRIYIYIYIYTHTYIHTHIHTYIHTYIHTDRQTDRHTYST